MSPALGPIVLQPMTNEPVDLERAQLVIFPHRVAKEEFNAAVEWAATTQTPIFCHSADVKKFEAEGFGAYRFHRLEGYKEVDFKGGAVEFYPARAKPELGLRSIVQNVGSALGLARVPSFHVLIRGTKEMSFLFLSSPHIDLSEWELLNRSRPEVVVGSSAFPKHEWHALSLRVKKKIIRAAEVTAPVLTVRPTKDAENNSSETVAEQAERERAAWTAIKAGSR